MVSRSAQIISPVMVGREPEIDVLQQALLAAQAGQGRCILIGGEAGVGKSRLLAEVRRRAVHSGFGLLEGHCSEQDVSFPYSLWINTLRGFFAWSSASEIAAQLGSLAAEFVKLLPELVLIMPGVQAAPPLDPESEKRRRFEALSRYMAQLAAPGPLLVALEDLHWSDEASLDFLRAFIPRIAGRPILLLATFRLDEQPPQLAHFLAQLFRERAAEELVLPPLTSSQAAVMIREILKLERLPGDELLDLMMQLTEGNPFFIEEVLKSLLEAGDVAGALAYPTRRSVLEFQVPSSVDESVRRRMDQLQPETRLILTLAAVAGQHFSLELLREVSEREEHSLLAAIREMIAAHLVVEESADRFAFRHALTREAIYATLLLRERQALHRQIGETMERLWGATGDSHAAELAYHFDQAAVWDKSLRYSRLAGEQAQRLHAPREALAQFSRAAAAAKRLDTEPSRLIMGARAHALELLGEFDRARADYEMALELAGSQQDREGEWATLVDLGFLWQSRDWGRAGGYFERALDLARSLGETALVAQSLNRIGNWYMNRALPREARSYHRQALQLYREAQDPRGAAQTLELLGLAGYFVGEVIQGAAYCEEALPTLRRMDDRQGLVNTLTNLSLRARFETEVLGDVQIERLASQSEAALEIARSCDWRQGEAEALSKLASCLCRAGDYGRGMELLPRALNIAEEIQHRQTAASVHLTFGAELYTGLLAAAEAREHLESALAIAQELGSALLTLMATARLAEACVLQGDLGRVQGLLGPVLHSDLPGETEMSILQRGCWSACAEWQLALGNPGRALEIVDRLLAGTVNLPDAGPQAVPRLAWLRGRALARLGRMDEAAVELEGAQVVARRQGQRPLLWRLHTGLGSIRRGMGRRAEAEREFVSAHRIAEDLANSLPEGALRASFLKRAMALIPTPAMPTPRQAARNEFGGLTERERQVAALVAEGKSNREIAEALVITVRGAEAHVTRILDRLGFDSRAEIAAWAVAKGLAHPVE